jgi:hypothetical protein
MTWDKSNLMNQPVLAQNIGSKIAPKSRQIGKNVDHQIACHAVDPADQELKNSFNSVN